MASSSLTSPTTPWFWAAICSASVAALLSLFHVRMGILAHARACSPCNPQEASTQGHTTHARTHACCDISSACARCQSTSLSCLCAALLVLHGSHRGSLACYLSPAVPASLLCMLQIGKHLTVYNEPVLQVRSQSARQIWARAGSRQIMPVPDAAAAFTKCTASQHHCTTPQHRCTTARRYTAQQCDLHT